MIFGAGERVVCINGRPIGGCPLPVGGVLPTEGHTYTIREIIETWKGPALLLVEIKNPPEFAVDVDGVGRFSEPAFDPRRFRPIRKTNIEIFRTMLLTVGRREGVSA